jgi:hypothetical protein
MGHTMRCRTHRDTTHAHGIYPYTVTGAYTLTIHHMEYVYILVRHHETI